MLFLFRMKKRRAIKFNDMRLMIHNPVLSSQERVIDYFVVFLFVLTSGSIFYMYLLSPAVTYIILLLVGFFNKLRIKNSRFYPTVQQNSSWWFVVFVAILSYIGDLYYSHQYDDRNLLGYIVVLLAAYFIVSSYNFFYFRNLLKNIVFFITLFGIPIFVLNELELISTTTLQLEKASDYTMFYCYTLGWPYIFHRFSGIWHEPGACQIVLNTVLWLYFDNLRRWKWNKGDLVKILVIGIGSVMTFSTGSYISLMLLLISIVLSLKIKSKHKLFIELLIISISLVTVFFIFSSETVQNKLFEDDSVESQVSTSKRAADAIALYEMTIDRPFLGYGLGTHDFWSTSTNLGNTSNSSGLLTFSAAFGILWFIVFCIVLILRLRQLGFKKELFFFFIAILAMQSNEKFIEYPITSLFVFTFGSYMISYKTEIKDEKSSNISSNSYI